MHVTRFTLCVTRFNLRAIHLASIRVDFSPHVTRFASLVIHFASQGVNFSGSICSLTGGELIWGDLSMHVCICSYINAQNAKNNV